LDRFRAMPPAERRAFLAGATFAENTRGRQPWRQLMQALQPPERQQLRQRVSTLSEGQRQQIFAQMQAKTDAQRVEFARQLIATVDGPALLQLLQSTPNEDRSQ